MPTENCKMFGRRRKCGIDDMQLEGPTNRQDPPNNLAGCVIHALQLQHPADRSVISNISAENKQRNTRRLHYSPNKLYNYKNICFPKISESSRSAPEYIIPTPHTVENTHSTIQQALFAPFSQLTLSSCISSLSPWTTQRFDTKHTTLILAADLLHLCI